MCAKYKIEKNVRMPKRGANRKKYLDLPLEKMEVGDSIRVDTAKLQKRMSVYSAVKYAVDRQVESTEGLKRNSFKVTSSIMEGEEDTCEIRVWKIK